MKTVFTLVRNFINAPRDKALYKEYLRHEYGIEPYESYDGLVSNRHPHTTPRSLPF